MTKSRQKEICQYLKKSEGFQKNLQAARYHRETSGIYFWTYMRKAIREAYGLYNNLTYQEKNELLANLASSFKLSLSDNERFRWTQTS